MKHDWYWAVKACDDAGAYAPAGDKFIIVNNKDVQNRELFWRRVRAELDQKENVAWMPIHRRSPAPTLEDILEILLNTVPMYGVSHNKFMLEAAQIPVFAKYLKGCDLHLFVSNPVFLQREQPVERYDRKVVNRLADVVGDTLGLDEGWFDAD